MTGPGSRYDLPSVGVLARVREMAPRVMRRECVASGFKRIGPVLQSSCCTLIVDQDSSKGRRHLASRALHQIFLGTPRMPP
jgi:hypothetical protein